MQKQTINTPLISTPSFSVSSKLTALHIASIAWDLYCEEVPNYPGEFSIHESSDFSAYNIQDKVDMSQHYFECAFAIGNSVADNVDYSVQEAYDLLDDFYGDTVVREEVSETVMFAVKNYAHTEDEDSSIAIDYADLVEDTAQALPTQIAQLEKQLAALKSKASA